MNLSGKAIRETAHQMLANGQSRASVYSQLLPQVDSEKKLAQAVASYIEPERYQQHKNKLDWLMAIMGLQVLIIFFGILAAVGIDGTSLAVATLMAALVALLAWQMYKLKPWAFFIFFVLCAQSLGKNIRELSVDPMVNISAIVVTLGILSFSYYVQYRFMPHMPFWTIVTRGKKEKYAFLEEGVSNS